MWRGVFVMWWCGVLWCVALCCVALRDVCVCVWCGLLVWFCFACCWRELLRAACRAGLRRVMWRGAMWLCDVGACLGGSVVAMCV